MLALRYYKERDIRLEDLPNPRPGKGEVLLRVTDAGISQTQINEFVEGPFIINREPHPLTGKATPLIPCQEYGGIIVEVGEGADENLLGKQVAVLPLVSCGKCKYCKEGRENLCDSLAYHGLLGLDGGFAEYSVVSARNIIPVEERSALTFVEPILVATHAANRYEQHSPLKGKKILILGAGAVGICIASVWRDCFGADIALNDILPPRMERAKEGGFKTIEKEDLLREYDIVVDAAGMDTLVDKPAIIEGLDYLNKGGILLNIGTYFHPVSFVPSRLLLNEQTICESVLYDSRSAEMVRDIIPKLDIDFKKFIKTIYLNEIIEKGYYCAEVDKESFTRIVVRPEA